MHARSKMSRPLHWRAHLHIPRHLCPPSRAPLSGSSRSLHQFRCDRKYDFASALREALCGSKHLRSHPPLEGDQRCDPTEGCLLPSEELQLASPCEATELPADRVEVAASVRAVGEERRIAPLTTVFEEEDALPGDHILQRSNAAPDQARELTLVDKAERAMFVRRWVLR